MSPRGLGTIMGAVLLVQMLGCDLCTVLDIAAFRKILCRENSFQELSHEEEKVRVALLASQASNRGRRGGEVFCGRMWDDHQHGRQAGPLQRVGGN